MYLIWLKIKAGRLLATWYQRQTRLDFWKITVIYCQFTWTVRSTGKNTPSCQPLPLFSSRLHFTLSLLTLLPSTTPTELVNVELRSVLKSSSLPLLSPHTFPIPCCWQATVFLFWCRLINRLQGHLLPPFSLTLLSAVLCETVHLWNAPIPHFSFWSCHAVFLNGF